MNVRFIGENLINLDKALMAIEIANEDYNLNWDTNSEIDNRLSWFRQLDLVAFKMKIVQYMRVRYFTLS